jgi:hypothetical protein
MGSLTLIMLIVVVLYFICIGITPKTSVEPASSWECDTCSADNSANAHECTQCGMERTAS